MTVDDQADSEVDVMEQVNIEAAGTSLCTFWELFRCCYIILLTHFTIVEKDSFLLPSPLQT